MTTYVYAAYEDGQNHLRTINASSMQDAKEKIIEEFRDEYDLDEEFDNWQEFLSFMEDYYEVAITQSIQDVEAL